MTKPSHDQPAAPAIARVSAASTPDDLLGFVSLARLASGSPALRDIGVFAWSQLRHLAPGATLALFAVDESRTSVVSRYAAGAAAESVESLTISLGERITGWVAANSRPMVDADAALDLGAGRDDTVRYALSMPLVSEHDVVGVLTLYSPEMFGHRLSMTVEMIAPHLASAVASALAAEATDRLTTAETIARPVKRKGLSLVARG